MSSKLSGDFELFKNNKITIKSDRWEGGKGGSLIYMHLVDGGGYITIKVDKDKYRNDKDPSGALIHDIHTTLTQYSSNTLEKLYKNLSGSSIFCARLVYEVCKSMLSGGTDHVR